MNQIYRKRINDSFSMTDSFMKNIKGKVKIFEERKKVIGKRLLFEGNNLIVDYGRIVALQRIHGTNINEAGSNYEKGKNQFISWCGVGQGGYANSAPVGPASNDTVLYDQLDIWSEQGQPSASYLVDGTKTPAWNYKIVEPAPTEEGISSKNEITIDFTDCGPADVEINEAALFTSDSFDGGGAGIHSVTLLTMFAHVCFPPILKTQTRKLIFEWYIYF